MDFFVSTARFCLSPYRAVVLLAAVMLNGGQPALAREQYQMNHPPGAPPVQALGAQAAPAEYVPKITPDFWKGQLSNRIPAGTVISGILEDDLSSDKSRIGDVFTITLQDGFTNGGKEILPAHAKILGAVVGVMPAKMLKHGHPGRLQVALKALVLPDGRNLPFSGHIDHNPNHDFKDAPKKKNLGHSFSDWGNSLSSFAGSFTSGIGVVLNKRSRGLEFGLDKGEVLPIRLNRSLDFPDLTSMPGQSGAQPLSGTSGAPAVPGMIGADPDAQPGAFLPAKPDDANSIFDQPIRSRPLADMPDPF